MSKKVEHWKQQVQDTVDRAGDELSRDEWIEFVGEILSLAQCWQDCIDEEERK